MVGGASEPPEPIATTPGAPSNFRYSFLEFRPLGKQTGRFHSGNSRNSPGPLVAREVFPRRQEDFMDQIVDLVVRRRQTETDVPYRDRQRADNKFCGCLRILNLPPEEIKPMTRSSREHPDACRCGRSIQLTDHFTGQAALSPRKCTSPPNFEPMTGKPEIIPQSASEKFNLTASRIRRHCRRRVHSRARETLEVVLSDRLHFCGCRSHAEEL